MALSLVAAQPNQSGDWLVHPDEKRFLLAEMLFHKEAKVDK
jgi:hypothetical protein